MGVALALGADGRFLALSADNISNVGARAVSFSPLGKGSALVTGRWRTDEMTPGSDAMKLLAEKVNREIQREHARQEVSPIKKPDWL